MDDGRQVEIEVGGVMGIGMRNGGVTWVKGGRGRWVGNQFGLGLLVCCFVSSCCASLLLLLLLNLDSFVLVGGSSGDLVVILLSLSPSLVLRQD